jgi:low affinity Fe/Cu permease
MKRLFAVLCEVLRNFDVELFVLRVMASHEFRELLTKAGVWTAHPAAFLLLACYGIAWLIFDPEALSWHGITVLATLFMTLVIQRAEHRDTQAIHAKLDELLKADNNARTELREIDKKDAEVIERHREWSNSKP